VNVRLTKATDVIAYYSTVVFKQSVGMSDHLALLMGGFVSLSFLVGTCISIPVIDRIGRRPVSVAFLPFKSFTDQINLSL
jgi:hypothetical protein